MVIFDRIHGTSIYDTHPHLPYKSTIHAGKNHEVLVPWILWVWVGQCHVGHNPQIGTGTPVIQPLIERIFRPRIQRAKGGIESRES